MRARRSPDPGELPAHALEGPGDAGLCRPKVEAIRETEQEMLRIPYYLSPGWLRVDPTFDRLRQHPRFRKLAKGT